MCVCVCVCVCACEGEVMADLLHFPWDDKNLLAEFVRLDQLLTTEDHIASLNGVHLSSTSLYCKK